MQRAVNRFGVLSGMLTIGFLLFDMLMTLGGIPMICYALYKAGIVKGRIYHPACS